MGGQKLCGLFARRSLELLDTARPGVPKSRMASRKAESSSRRTNHIRVRLAPAPRPAVEVTLDDTELAAIDRAVSKHELDGRSALFRSVGWFAASKYATNEDSEAAFRAAAEAAHMGIGEWLRYITLSAIGEGDFCEQLGQAREAVNQGRLA